jgi:hypothetical protein
LAADELPEPRDSLVGKLVGERALALLGPLTTPSLSGAHRRFLVVNGVTACDAYAGAVLRASIDLHLARDPGNLAQIWEPKDLAVWRRLHDLLLPLPERCELVGDQEYPERDPEIILPAFRIEDSEQAALLGHTVVRAHSSIGLEIQAARAAAEAIAVFADNAHKHAPDSPLGVLLACALQPDTRELQVVALDLGQESSANPEPVQRLRDLVAQSRRDIGGLASLLDRAEGRRLAATLRLASGGARARWATGARLRYEEATPVPGFVAGFTVRL